MAANNIRAKIYHSGDWQATPSYERVEVSSTWGLADEGTALGASVCTLQLNNRGNAYNPDDARSSLYGLIGRNTPGRVLLMPGLDSGALSDTADAFGRTVSAGWGSTDSGEAWTVPNGSGGTVQASDYDVASGAGTMYVPVAEAYRYAYLDDINVRDVDVAVTVTVAQATGGSLFPANILLRGDSDLTYIRGRVELTTANAVNIVIINRANTVILGSATVDGLTHTGAGQPLRVRMVAAGTRYYMRVWAAASAEPDEWHLTVTDTSEVPAHGWVGLRSGRDTGNTNTTDPQFSYDDWETTTLVPIADGAVASWEPDRDTEWDAEGTRGDAWTDIRIAGPSERVNASKGVFSAMRSTLKAAISAGTDAPEAYWPMEDGPNTLKAEQLVPGMPTLDVYQGVSSVSPGVVKFGEGTPTAGSRPVVDLSGGGSLRVVLPDTGNFVDQWAVDWVSTFPLNGASTEDGVAALMLEIISDSGNWSALSTTSGTLAVPGWEGFVGPVVPDENFEANTVAEAPPGFPAAGLPDPYSDGLPHHYRIHASQDGSEITFLFYYDGFQVARVLDDATGDQPIGTLGRITELRVNGDHGTDGGDFMPSLGQLVVWYGDPPDMGTSADAAHGYVGETCAARYLRVLAERSIPGAIYGDADSTHTMGAQQPDTLAGLLGEIARTDSGLVYDGRAWDGFEFRTGESLRNQTAALALTYGVNVAPPIRPATDSLGIANDITANAREGTVARAEKTSGPLNVNDPIDDPEGISRVEGQVDLNPETDLALVNAAGWELHKGTWPGARYKNVTVDLSKHPELLPAVMAMRPGDLITIDELDADQVELLALGGAHSLRSYHHLVTFNCAPAGPYRVGQVETDGFMRIGSADTVLAEDFESGTDTRMVVDVRGKRWGTSNPPFHIRVGGVVLNATAISEGAELATVGTAAHADNASISPSLPANIQVGDILLMWVSSRNTALTSPTVTGWEKLFTVTQGALYWREVVGGESAPTVTYSGGSAGDTVSGQISRWRQIAPDPVNATSGVQSNASAQNIATPALAEPSTPNCLILLLAWRQDDFTGITPPAGFTEIDRFSTTTGSDQSMYWAYRVQSAQPFDVAADTIAVVGGASAISKAILVAIEGRQVFTVDATPVNGVERTILADGLTSLARVNVAHPLIVAP